MRFLVFSNAVDGRDDEYNEWYDKVHLPEVLSVPGVRAGARYRVKARDSETPEHRYLAVYDLEGDGEAVVREIMTRSGNGQFRMTDSIDGASAKVALWEEI